MTKVTNVIPNSVFYSHSRGIPGPIGNPIPMHISTIDALSLFCAQLTRDLLAIAKFLYFSVVSEWRHEIDELRDL